MKEISKPIIKYRLQRARESLNDAQTLFNAGSLYSTVNRIYYAMFYSVIGLLLSENLSSSKHSGVKALFSKEFVNKGIVGKNLGSFYSEMFEKRQKSDYKDLVEFKKEDVQKWLKKAEEFINKIEELTLRLIKVTNDIEIKL